MTLSLEKLKELATNLCNMDDFSDSKIQEHLDEWDEANIPTTILKLLRIIELQKEALEFYADNKGFTFPTIKADEDFLKNPQEQIIKISYFISTNMAREALKACEEYWLGLRNLHEIFMKNWGDEK